jgi:hypothetical protein
LVSIAPVLFYGLCIRTLYTRNMPAFAIKHANLVEGYYYITELCDGALSDELLGIENVESEDIWQILSQVTINFMLR